MVVLSFVAALEINVACWSRNMGTCRPQIVIYVTHSVSYACHVSEDAFPLSCPRW